MHDLNDLYYFVQVVDHQGFAAAGRALGLPKSKLSRRLGLLEARLGVRLIQRSTRRFSVTELGQNYYTHCKAMLVEAETAQQMIDRTRAEPRGVVRMTCPVAMLDAGVAGMVARFMLDHPQVEVHLEATNRRVDVVGEGIDLALRVRPPPLDDSDLVVRVLGQRRQSLVASPALLALHGPIEDLGRLAELPSLALGAPRDDHHWRLFHPTKGATSVRHRPRLVSGSMAFLRTAALHGVGVVQMPDMMVGPELADASLLRVVEPWAPLAELVHVVFPTRRGLLPAVRALIDDLAVRFAALEDR